MRREAFTVVGYTIVVPPHDRTGIIPRFWDEVVADGRLARLREASSVPPWVFGMGSWDPACQKHGSRYTICIEETEHTDFAPLARDYTLLPKDIGASDWMCFGVGRGDLEAYKRFWRDNPYKMMGKLGYGFHTSPGYTLGLHLDAYPPDHDEDTNPVAEFWITVTRP